MLSIFAAGLGVEADWCPDCVPGYILKQNICPERPEAPAFANFGSILSGLGLAAGLFQKKIKICPDGCQGRPGIIRGPLL
jgi:hypothetical protein